MRNEKKEFIEFCMKPLMMLTHSNSCEEGVDDDLPCFCGRDDCFRWLTRLIEESETKRTE